MAMTALVVGASVAGTRVATELRRLGYDGHLVLIDSQDELPYDRPPLSKAMLTGTNEAAVRLLTEEDAAAHGIELRLGVGAVSLDTSVSRVVLEDGTAMQFDDLVIATGARPRTSPWPSHPRMLELRTLEDGRRLREALRSSRTVAVVGAGFIGSEVASAARALGLDVVVIDPVPIPMARLLGAEVGALLSELHVNNGAEARFGIGVASVEADDAQVRLALSDHSVIKVDIVVVGIGVQPNVEWLTSSGLAVDDGVVCDSRCRALGHDNIYAVGDVARWLHPQRDETVRIEHWTNALEQAQFVAKAVARPESVTEFAPVEYVWSDQYDWKIQIAGRPHRGVDHELIVRDDRPRICALYADLAGVLTGGLAVNWPKATILMRRALAAGASVHDLAGSIRAL